MQNSGSFKKANQEHQQHKQHHKPATKASIPCSAKTHVLQGGPSIGSVLPCASNDSPPISITLILIHFYCLETAKLIDFFCSTLLACHKGRGRSPSISEMGEKTDFPNFSTELQNFSTELQKHSSNQTTMQTN